MEVSPGHVVCIEKSNKLIFDVNHNVRLVDTEAYDVKDASELYGLVCGILATNYDVKDLFIDSSLKICNDNVAAWAEFLQDLRRYAKSTRFSALPLPLSIRPLFPRNLRSTCSKNGLY